MTRTPPTRVAMLATLVVLAASCTAQPGSTTLDPTTTAATVTTTAPAPTTTTVDRTTTIPPNTATTSTTIPAFEGTVIEIEVTDGDVTGGGRIPVPLGDRVRLVVTVGASDEVHLHGYDLSAPVAPGQPAVIEFPADIPGVFELELEAARLQLGELEVSP